MLRHEYDTIQSDLNSNKMTLQSVNETLRQLLLSAKRLKMTLMK